MAQAFILPLPSCPALHPILPLPNCFQGPLGPHLVLPCGESTDVSGLPVPSPRHLPSCSVTQRCTPSSRADGPPLLWGRPAGEGALNQSICFKLPRSKNIAPFLDLTSTCHFPWISQEDTVSTTPDLRIHSGQWQYRGWENRRGPRC